MAENVNTVKDNILKNDYSTVICSDIMLTNPYILIKYPKKDILLLSLLAVLPSQNNVCYRILLVSIVGVVHYREPVEKVHFYTDSMVT